MKSTGGAALSAVMFYLSPKVCLTRRASAYLVTRERVFCIALAWFAALEVTLELEIPNMAPKLDDGECETAASIAFSYLANLSLPRR